MGRDAGGYECECSQALPYGKPLQISATYLSEKVFLTARILHGGWLAWKETIVIGPKAGSNL